ncbi:amino acid ABC transporter permease [Actinocatenispora rupis]|uniref:Amino acid ABC transporter permease n=1 Tax=Actinocatenispora rupis TaxID=519421 RepID=A0A8J3J4A2_9ACTN|nr:amino acid ABC transporter permease [Actinocatenispora rupis]GID13928.1 amino acid ABC transporter permease [Actinocatenispora rupis]
MGFPALAGDLLHGFVSTVEIVALSFVGALLVGTLIAVCRISPVLPLRAFGWLYVEAFRAVPLLVLLVLCVFGLPWIGLTLSPFASVVLGIALYAGAIVCETLRSGVRGVPLGQVEAARALGFTFGQSLRHVVLPQAFRVMVQPFGNVFIGVVLGTSLCAAVGAQELTYATKVLDIQGANPLVTFGLAAVLYIAVTLGSGYVFGRIERRVRFQR